MSVPKLRFPEFRDSGEWEEKKLGEVATFYNGKAYKQEELLDQCKYRVLRVGNFFTNNNWYYSDLELDDTKYCD
ncbi:MAG: restriction endonuclease subunit S, partial [Pseudanabaena sp.]